MRLTALSLSVVLLGALSLACSDDDGSSNNNKICAPGATQVCACPGGTQGVQTCNITGASWSTCNCGGTKHDGGGGGKVCVPGSTKACTCSGGLSGVQSCKQDGKSYSGCDCSKLDGGAVKLDKGGGGKKAVGKFCHALVGKNGGGTLTITMKIGSGASQVSLAAWSKACSTVVGVQCHQLPTGNNLPVEFWLQGQVVAKGSVNISAGKDYVFFLDMDKTGTALLSGGELKAGYTCQSFKPYK